MDILELKISESRRSILQAAAALGLGSLALGTPAMSVAATKKSSLQTKVNAYVKAQRRRGRVAGDEKTSWSVYDFTTGTKLVAINEDTPRQAASMIKPFVAQAYFYRHQAAPSRYPYNAEVEQLMASMIRHSRNHATNELIARVSNKKWAHRPKEVERILKQQAPGVFQQTEVVEYIPKGGRTYRNKASAHDYSRFLFGMWNNRFPGSEHMKELLALPNADRIRQGTNKIPDTYKVLDKTGSTAHLCGNMGIVVAKGKNGKSYPYTVIGIIEKQKRPKSYSRWIRSRGNVIREVSDLVYSELRKAHNLV